MPAFHDESRGKGKLLGARRRPAAYAHAAVESLGREQKKVKQYLLVTEKGRYKLRSTMAGDTLDL